MVYPAGAGSALSASSDAAYMRMNSRWTLESAGAFSPEALDIQRAQRRAMRGNEGLRWDMGNVLRFISKSGMSVTMSTLDVTILFTAHKRARMAETLGMSG